jgi:hypothetical protein
VLVRDVDDRTGLAQQLVVDVQAASGVDDDRVMPGERRPADRVTRDGDRVPLGHRRMHGDPGAGGDDAQLLDGGGTLQVAGDEHRTATLRREVLRKLASDGRLARTLETCEHDDGWRSAGEVEGDVLSPERRAELEHRPPG